MSDVAQIKQKEFLGHPVGLFVLFFTEMWERFSYYGMRGILALYVATSATAVDPGLGWSNKDALWLYGWYTMLVYVASIPGGIIADKILGHFSIKVKTSVSSKDAMIFIRIDKKIKLFICCNKGSNHSHGILYMNIIIGTTVDKQIFSI